jgi:hypothetical protein
MLQRTKKKLEVKPVLTLFALKIHTIMYGEKLAKKTWKFSL